MIIKPKNWQDFQHYKDRSPPWIKLHKTILDNYEFQMLPDASKALAMCLWLVASEHLDGEIDADPSKLAFRFRSSEKKIEESLKPLIDGCFFAVLRDDSGVLAENKQNAPLDRGETETETEIEAEKNIVIGKLNCPHQEIINLYHETLPTSPRIKDWTPARAASLRARWNEATDRQTLDYWKSLFEYIAGIPFLTGRTPSGNGRRPFVLSLDWLLKAENFAKVREGRYEDQQA